MLVTSPPGSGRPMVSAVLERRSAVVRAQAAAGSSYGQVLAANADVAAVVEGMVLDLDPARVERLLALAWSSGARPMVLLTKADLVPDPLAVVAVLAAVEAGDLPRRRLESRRRLEREQARQAARTDHRLAAEGRARWKAVARSQRRSPERR